jgi:hypothetical protein
MEKLKDCIIRILDRYPDINMASEAAKKMLADRITTEIQHLKPHEDEVSESNYKQVLFNFNGYE